MITITLDLVELADRVLGPVLGGDDPRVAEEVATFNLAVTHRPTVVVGATCTEDVAAAVGWAAEQRLPVAVQATGHGPVRPVLDGLLVTTTRMTTVEVDPVRRTATVGAGARWADVLAAAAPYGLAGVCGSSSAVGVVGFCVGGGVGPLGREYGFGADQVLGAEVVTADGRVHRLGTLADPDPAPEVLDAELFWAVRGGKGNLGIVTVLEIGLVPVAELLGGAIFFDGAAAHDVLHSFRSWSPTLPDRTSTSVALLNLPPLPELPEPLRGRYVVMLRFSHHGTIAEGAELIAPMLEAGPVLLDGVGVIPFTDVDIIHQDPTAPLPAWEKGSLLRELPAEAVDALLAVAGPDAGAPLAMVELRLLGGALARQPSVPNAVAGREGAYSLMALGVLAPEIAHVVPAVGNGVLEAMAPWGTSTTLVNWLGATSDPAEVGRAWIPQVHRRLMAVKRDVDPGNMFRFGHALGV